MKCKKIKNRLSAFVDGELALPEQQAISDHLRACRECSALAERLHQVYVSLPADPDIPANPFFITRLRAELARRSDARQEGLWRPWMQKSLIPATIVLGLLIGRQLGVHLNQGWADARYGQLESQAFAEMQTTVTESYLSLNGWTEVKNEE
jgi:anti-sigma factor RsiW